MLLRRVEHAAQQVHDDRQDDEQQDDVSDPPEGHRGLLSATTAALLAIPGSAPRMTSNWALIALTAGSSGRRCSASTPSSAVPSVARPSEILVEAAAHLDQRDGEHEHDDDRQHDASGATSRCVLLMPHRTRR